MIKRRLVRGVSAWVFGLATTIFLIALWGRAVVIDVESLQKAAAPLGASTAIVEIFTEWLDTELVEAGVDETTSELVIEDVLSRSSVGVAMEQFAAELVQAAAAPGPEQASVDVAGLLQPAVPEIGDALALAGIPIPESRIAELVAGLDPLVIRDEATEPYIGAASPTASRLGIAAVLALVAMAVSAWIAVVSSDNRLDEVRGLLSRVALGGLSFAILLKVGSWVLDPRGGRAPVAESTSIVVGSKWLVPLVVASVAGAAGVGVVALRRGAGSPSAAGPPTQQLEPQPLRSR